MDILLIFGVIYTIVVLFKESCEETKPAGFDFEMSTKEASGLYNGTLTKREMRKMVSSGRYHYNHKGYAFGEDRAKMLREQNKIYK